MQLHTDTWRTTVDGWTVIRFLKRLLRGIRGPISLIWDSAGIHIRKIVKVFIAAHPRLTLIYLPKYAPELNPVEYVWTQVTHALAGHAPRDLPQLRTLLQAAVRRIRSTPWRLRACFRSAPLNWKGLGVK